MPTTTITVALISTWQVFSEIVKTLHWGYAGFRLGLLIGFLGGILAASSLNSLIVFAFAVRASIIALLIAILYRERRSLRLRLRNLWEMLIGFSTGAVVVFIVALYYFWLTVLAMIAVGLVTAGYNFFEMRGAMIEASIELRHLIRNMYVLIAIMVPLLFFVILVLSPDSKGPIPILAWAFAYSVSSLVVLGRFLRERRDRRKSG